MTPEQMVPQPDANAPEERYPWRARRGVRNLHVRLQPQAMIALGVRAEREPIASAKDLFGTSWRIELLLLPLLALVISFDSGGLA